MNLKPYPDYKHCKTAWLPKIPSHWLEAQLRTCIEFIANGITATQIEQGEETVPVTRIETISTGRFNPEKAGHISRQEADPRRRMEVGDISLSNINSLSMIGNCAMLESPTELYAGMNLLHIRPSRDCFPEWLAWSFRNSQFRDDIESRAKPAINQASISQGGLKSIRIPIPPLEEQIQISRFLHHETAKIDALIAEQQRLIELLQEKRQVVISHAVTKGLNPNAPMKDSGVEWLGEVPEHWSIKQIKHLCKSIEQGWSPQCENEPSEGDAPGVLKVGCVNGGLFRPSENKKLPPELAPVPQYSVKIGDLLVSRANTKELVGSVAVAAEDFPWLYICDKLYRITIKPQSSSSKYLALYLASREARGQIELGASGASPSMQNISQSVLLDMSIPVPQLDEQESIRNDITIQCDQIDQLTAKVMEAIRLFQERRSALISAAVTGQIDVRGLTEEVAA